MIDLFETDLRGGNTHAKPPRFFPRNQDESIAKPIQAAFCIKTGGARCMNTDRESHSKLPRKQSLAADA